MATVVELGNVEGFILDDPVAGVLDNTEYTLGGTVFLDITDRMISVGVSRGKNRDLDRFNAGSLQVVLNNNDRAFDPNYSPSPFFGAIIPRREVRVTVDGERVIETTIDELESFTGKRVISNQSLGIKTFISITSFAKTLLEILI